MAKSIKARVTYRVTEVREFTLEELGLEEDIKYTSSELQSAIQDYTEQVAPGIDAYVDCERVDFIS